VGKKDTDKEVFGGIEAGGTKFVCAIGSGPKEIYAISKIDTREPNSTIREVVNFFQAKQENTCKVLKIGIGSFGPLDLDAKSKTYGHIKKTSKLGWEYIDIRGELERALKTQVVIDTDVNVAAMGELTWGYGQALQNFLYATIGTGIGVGAVINKQIIHTEHHPEMGHMFVPLSTNEQEKFSGNCLFHGGCIEGLASGPAITERWGNMLCQLEKTHPAWQLEAEYLATFFANLTFVLQPQKIIAGGGVMNEYLLKLVRQILYKKITGYSSIKTSDYLVMPGLGSLAGVLGAIAFARNS